MDQFSIADAKAHLSELIDRIIAGDSIGITRRGVPVAKLVPMNAPKRPINLAELRAITDAQRG